MDNILQPSTTRPGPAASKIASEFNKHFPDSRHDILHQLILMEDYCVRRHLIRQVFEVLFPPSAPDCYVNDKCLLWREDIRE